MLLVWDKFVDISMLDSMISAMTSNFMIYLGSGSVPEPLVLRMRRSFPIVHFPPRISTSRSAVGSEKLWRAFGPAIGHAELVDHPAYATNSMRVKNRVQLESLLADVFRTDTMENWAS